jgi:diguanylate cyclase (GGDEF)-like protein
MGLNPTKNQDGKRARDSFEAFSQEVIMNANPRTTELLSQTDKLAHNLMRSELSILLATSLIVCSVIYNAQDWYAQSLLPSLGIRPTLGDPLGGLLVNLGVFAALRFISMLIFGDAYVGVVKLTDHLRASQEKMRNELDQLWSTANTDRLTGAWNRTRLDSILKNEMDRRMRHGNPLCMLVMDIDHFKRVNDTKGHDVGDQVLIELVKRVNGALRASDTLVRWGGEEFVVLCPDTSLATAITLAERLRKVIEERPFVGTGKVTVSIGVAECRRRDSWAAWFKRADQAVYRAMEGGRNRVEVSADNDSHPVQIERKEQIGGTRLRKIGAGV